MSNYNQNSKSWRRQQLNTSAVYKNLMHTTLKVTERDPKTMCQQLLTVAANQHNSTYSYHKFQSYTPYMCSNEVNGWVHFRWNR